MNQESSAINRIPLATYRLQFNRDFTFSQAEEILSYLAELGISDLYASPLFLAGPESTHGYDVCSFERFSPNLGGAAGFQSFASTLRQKDLGLLLDMVPNHMGSSSGNSWWNDVLREGPNSRYAPFFDVDWNSRHDRKVLLPVLGDRYSEVLHRGELRLDFDVAELCLAYFDRKFPLSRETQEKLRKIVGPNGTIHSVQALKDLVTQINRDQNRLHEIIQAQHYRLAFWRLGPHEINYRRFFDVTELVSVRVEERPVFDETHRFLFERIKAGEVTGVRVDHPDGLRDPKTYFDWLQEAHRAGGASRRLFVVAEKILSNGEQLSEDWAVAGTTGYDYLNYLNGAFVATESETQFTDIYQKFSGCSAPYSEVEYEAKKYVLQHLFPKELSSLVARLRQIADQTPTGIDISTAELETALAEYIADFPVYRTYARAGLDHLSKPEEQYVRTALLAAGKRLPQGSSIWPLLEKILLLQTDRSGSAAFKEQCAEFVFRLQQLTGPATAKGLEDTAFYRYVRFVSLNEVGGNPGNFGASMGVFHAFNLRQQEHWPHSQLATATHDTKRGEDIRARLNVLSEVPTEWKAHLDRWEELNRPAKTLSGSDSFPSRNDEYLLYQMLLGSWTGPSDLDNYIDRIQRYMQKASREAKVLTSWTDPNQTYEDSTRQFVDALLHSEAFLESFEPFAKRLAFFGVFNSLAQVLLKICSSGVPDFYQGAELWDFNLVDPDNRRRVDYSLRKKTLAKIKTAPLGDLLQEPESGEVKMFVTWAALQFRRRHSQIFASGKYVPLYARGGQARHVVAFARERLGKSIVVVAPRLPLTLAAGEARLPIGPEIWRDTELDLSGSYRDHFTQKQRTSGKLSELLADFPLALLESV